MSAIQAAASSQPVQALELAIRVRRARSMLKARIANGQIAAAEVILTHPSEAASMPVAQLLTSQRGWGETRSRAFLAQIGVPEDKTIGSLTERQRQVIAAQLTHAVARAERVRAPDPLGPAPRLIRGRTSPRESDQG